MNVPTNSAKKPLVPNPEAGVELGHAEADVSYDWDPSTPTMANA